ncbi:NnrS family protein [Azospirillum sp.]|uniref:NnrS family protein n=1 Tax=Azospirillum sp. TaxID=34012 RepID=UPI002D376591|nr:NnrS family protein [Azospirillum sp.]HYD67212.1 NnrS family protein [Azospirillum sp.]
MSMSATGSSPRIHLPLLVSYGFRPFFLFAGVSAFGLVAAWLAVLAHGTWPAGPIAPAHWHAHEMLFGFTASAIAGFLLTAVPSWTGTTARSGWWLGVLVGLWLAGRAVVFPGLGVPPVAAALIDLAFFPMLGVALAAPLIKAGKARNTAFLGLLALLGTANLLFHLEWLGVLGNGVKQGEALGIGVVLMMIAVVGGRIIPAFTRNALAMQGIKAEVSSVQTLEYVVLGSTLLMIPADLILPGSVVAGLLALVAAVAHGLRLARWQGLKTLDQPIVWVLHAGYAWVPVGLALKAAALLGGFVAETAWLHAITTGAFATMILAVMTRASLGHTGRPLVVGKPIAWAYRLLIVAAAARVLAAEVDALYWPLLDLAGLAWLATFAIYLAVYAPILLSPRADGRPG